MLNGPLIQLKAKGKFVTLSSKILGYFVKNLIFTFTNTYRDLGKFIRDKVKTAFESSERQNLDSELCTRHYNSLNKLADNHYKNKYKRTQNSTATGLSTEECNLILSNEVLQYLKEENKGFFSKILNKDSK